MKKYLITWLVSVSVLLIFIIEILTPIRVYSHFENRYLMQPPKLSLNDIINNRFSLDYEKYINDQFVFRDRWISLKSWVEATLNKKENNGIYFGKDRFLFEKMIAPSQQLEINTLYLNEFLEKYPDLPIQIIMPLSSYTLYPHLLPDHAPVFDQLAWLKSQSNWPIIDIHDPLKRSTDQTYYRNDHHWTTHGAYLAYVAIMETLGQEPLSWQEFPKQATNGFLGTYYAKGKPTDPLSDTLIIIDPKIVSYRIGNTTFDSLIDMTKLQAHDKYAAFLRGNHGFASIKVNESEQPTRLLVIKDSFANSLVPFLTAHYDEIDVIDLRHYSGSIQAVIDTGYDDILFVHSFSQFAADTSIAKLRY